MHKLSSHIIRNITNNRQYIYQTKTSLTKKKKKDFRTLSSNAHDIENNYVSNQKLTTNFNISKRNYSDDKNQKQNLLKYPVQPLDETINKFILSIEPVLNDAELCKTKDAAEKFLREDGPKLQMLLENEAANEQNWLAKRWMRYAYLQGRDQVTVYSSPGQTMPIQNFKTDKDYYEYVGKAIGCILQFKCDVEMNKIPVVKMGKNELDNSQFNLVLGTCRIPQKDEDFMEYHSDSKHIVIIHKNHFYKLPVYDTKGHVLRIDIITKQIAEILEAEKKCGIPFGILTHENRDRWAESYQELLKDEENAKSLCEIQTALFTVSLDDDVPVENGEEWNVHAQQLITGGGSKFNSGNRFMDKTIQLVCNRNGMVGFSYEHTPAEGQPVAIIADFIIENVDKIQENVGSAHDYDKFSKLELKSNKIIDEAIEKAKLHVDILACNLLMNILRYDGYGKGFCKTQKLSPDSFLQMALQVAFYRLHGEHPAQYETAHLRIFEGGRTETIRSCCTEAALLAKVMASEKISAKDRASFLRSAVERHRNLTTMALQGKGIDRHLLGLKLMAIENNKTIPEYFYTSPGYVKSTYWRVSTSQVASKHRTFMCYGAAVKDGYACCYNILNDEMILSLSSYRANDERTDLKAFTQAVVDALDDMGAALCATNPPIPKAKL